MPWVPRDLYALMVDALRERAGLVASPGEPVWPGSEAEPNAAPVCSVAMTAGEPAAPAIPPLPDVVAQACVEFAYGDKAEISANYRAASEWHAKGSSPKSIVERIRRGASPDALFVG